MSLCICIIQSCLIRFYMRVLFYNIFPQLRCLESNNPGWPRHFLVAQSFSGRYSLWMRSAKSFLPYSEYQRFEYHCFQTLPWDFRPARASSLVRCFWFLCLASLSSDHCSLRTPPALLGAIFLGLWMRLAHYTRTRCVISCAICY